MPVGGHYIYGRRALAEGNGAVSVSKGTGVSDASTSNTQESPAADGGEEEGTYVLLPKFGGGHYCVFSDGSSAEWLPLGAPDLWRTF